MAAWTNVGDLGTSHGLGFGTGSAAWGPDWLSAFTTAPSGAVLHAIYHVTTNTWTHESWGAPSGANLYNQVIGATSLGTGYLLADAVGSNLAQEKTWLNGTQGSWAGDGAPPGGLAPPLGWVEASAW